MSPFFGKLLNVLLLIFLSCSFLDNSGLSQSKSTSWPRYYASIYSYDDGVLNLPRNAHSYGAFVAYDHENGVIVEEFSISWLPADGSVCALGGIEMGRNYSLAETMRIAWDRRLDVIRFGPHQVTAEFFDKARDQWQRLERASFDGSILYKAIDGDLRFRDYQPVVNCMHALTGIVGDLEFGSRRGRAASSQIDQFFSRYYLEYGVSPEIEQVFREIERK